MKRYNLLLCLAFILSAGCQNKNKQSENIETAFVQEDIADVYESMEGGGKQPHVMLKEKIERDFARLPDARFEVVKEFGGDFNGDGKSDYVVLFTKNCNTRYVDNYLCYDSDYCLGYAISDGKDYSLTTCYNLLPHFSRHKRYGEKRPYEFTFVGFNAASQEDAFDLRFTRFVEDFGDSEMYEQDLNDSITKYLLKMEFVYELEQEQFRVKSIGGKNVYGKGIKYIELPETELEPVYAYDFSWQHFLLMLREQPAPSSRTTKPVSNAKEFIEAIDNNTRIKLATHMLNITADSIRKYIPENSNILELRYNTDLVIKNISNLEIIAPDYINEEWEGEGRPAIVTDNEQQIILGFDSCSNIMLTNIDFYHSSETNMCDGEVVCFWKSNNITIQRCEFNGSGTVGLTFYQTSDVTVLYSSLYNNSEEALGCYESTNINFSRSHIFENVSQRGNVIEIIGSEVTFSDCSFSNNKPQGNHFDFYINFSNEAKKICTVQFFNCSFDETDMIHTRTDRQWYYFDDSENEEYVEEKKTEYYISDYLGANEYLRFSPIEHPVHKSAMN